MNYIPIVDRDAFVASTLYDIIHVSSSPYTIMPYAFYVSGFGKALYAAYYIEKHGLWNDLFHRILGFEYKSSSELDKALELIKGLEIPMWKEIGGELAEIHSKISKLYRSLEENIIGAIRRVFGFKEFFKKMYVIYGFTPLPRNLYGSMLYWNNEYIILSIYINDMLEPSQIVDILIHEILHGLMRLNNIELRGKIEELLIDISCPEGYLSRMIGLSIDVKVDEIAEKYEDLADLVMMVISYYENRVYDSGISILKWIKDYMSTQR